MSVVNNLGSFQFDLGGMFGFDSVLIGGFGDNTLNGGGGNDLLIGGLGHNTLNGGGGNDLLIGGLGNDILNGGPGDDVLRGGFGDNTMTGGPGQDTFAPFFGHDIITDFSPLFMNKTVHFDDLTIGGVGFVPNGYEGFNWGTNAVYAVREWLQVNYPGSGFINVINSEGTIVVNNTPFSPVEISHPTNDFDFNSGFFAVGNMNDVTLTLTAYDDNVQVGQAFIVLDTQKVFIDLENMTALGADSATFNGRFTSVDRVSFVGTGGVDAGIGGLAGVAPWVGADDLSFQKMGDDDLIELPWGVNPADIIASATSDGFGGTLLDQGNDTTQILGVPPTDLADAWFI